MFLPLPASTITDLTSAHYQEPSVNVRRSGSDPDGFMTSAALQPDPVYLGLRTIFAAGPIGRLRARYEAWQEAREERRHAAERAVAAASHIVRQSQASTSTIADRDRIDLDLAA